MAARAITRDLYSKAQALQSVRNRVSVYPGIRRNVQSFSSTALTQTTKEEGKMQEESRKPQRLEELLIKEVHRIQNQNLDVAGIKRSHRMMKKWLDIAYDKLMEELQRRHLQMGWECLRDFLRSNGMENCDHNLLLSINHSGSSEEVATVGFATGSPEEGLESLRRSVVLPQRPGAYELPRQTVRGVVCFTTKDKDAFLLYHATTGDRSTWIDATSQPRQKARCQVVSIALGYAPKSRRHKVVCLSIKSPKKIRKLASATSGELLVVEVLTVRANTWDNAVHDWRRVQGVEAPPAYSLGNQIAIIDGPVYSDGQIYWLCRYARSDLSLLKFDVEAELFTIMLVPDFIVDEFMDSSLHSRLKLMKVGGDVAILKSTVDQQEASSLCICHCIPGSEDGEVKWREEKVPVPYAFVSPYCSVEALTGTDLIFVQSDDHLISYHNRKTKESLSFEIPASLRDHRFGWGRMIQLQ